MRDYEEKSYYEIQLDNKQLIFVFFAAVTVCVLIFVLGVMVGKGQKEAEMAAAPKEKPIVSKPELDVTPPRQPKAVRETTKSRETQKTEPADSDQEQYTFYDLDKPEDSAESQEVKKQPRKAVEAARPPETPKPKVEEAKPKEETNPPVFSSEEPAIQSAEEKTTEKKAQTTTEAEVAKYTVQIMATASRTKADEEIKFLRSKGFMPYLDEFKTESGAVYKVRIGEFSEPESARQLASRLKKELQLETWVALLE